MNPDGESILHEGAKIKIGVGDSGVGISKEQLPHIFDRFYRIDNTVTHQQNGSGIGLALTKELIEIHKGKIEVESELNKGTKFFIELPIHPKQTENAEMVAHQVKNHGAHFYPVLSEVEDTHHSLLENSPAEMPNTYC